ncbi:MAG: SusC/RagA family TonB-linked outer membrane protein [Ferruginibacter sp.]
MMILVLPKLKRTQKSLLCIAIMLAFLPGIVFSQTKNISGKITDANGTPLANVSVVIKGSSVGTTTAADGSYSFSAPADARQIEFSILGFETQDFVINGRSRISTSLVASSKLLEQVVVTGINKVKKSEYAGAASKVSEREIKNVPVASFDQVLQGKAPGVTVLSSSGAPGTSAGIFIRGQGSIQGGVAPLYVVDGIPVEPGVFQGMNSNDFQSIDILRDASAAALYGSRGSAGVIVITTKRGSSGKVRMTFSHQTGIKEKPTFPYRPMNTTELLKAQEDYGKIVGASASTPVLPGYYYSHNNPRYAALSDLEKAVSDRAYDSISKINTNWIDEVFRRGQFQNTQLTFSGGTGKTRIYSSVALYHEEGITTRSDLRRVTARNNLDYSDDKFSIAVSLNIGYTKRNFIQSAAFNTSNPFSIATLTAPYAKVKNVDGSYVTGTGTLYLGANQLDITELDQNYSDQLKGTLGFTLEYKLSKSFSAALTTGVDFRETQATVYGNPLAYLRQSSTTITTNSGSQTETLTRFVTPTVRPSITYRKTVSNRHDIEITALTEYIRQVNKAITALGFGVDPKRPNSIAAITQGNGDNRLYAQIGGGKSENTLSSGLIMGRYTFNKKYSFTGSYRQDGSSKLPSDNRWTGFYSLGGIWELSRENFIRNVRGINSLRLRASYGSSGNADNIPGGDYPYQASYTGGQYGALKTIEALSPGNPNLKWETTYITNIGVDFELFNRRLYGNVDVYDKVTKDLFVQKTLSATAGFGNGASLDVNAGELSNRGFEFIINADVIRNKNMTWTIFANGSYNKNKVVSLGGETSFEQGTELISVGLPLGSHYNVEWAGVDAATGQPLYYDKNGRITNVFNGDDAVQKFGTWDAPWKGGFGTNIRYKGFDLSLLFSWQRGGTKNDNLEFFTQNPAQFLGVGYNQSSDLNFWKKPGDIATSPSPIYAVNPSSERIHDASFLRLRDLSIGYNFPKGIGKSKLVSNLRVYLQGNNLFIWTKWRGMDPEAGAVNINLSEFPNPRTLTAGLEITF